MSDLLTRVFGSLKAGMASGAAVALAVMLPVAATAATAQTGAKLGGSLGVANVTAGDAEYKQAVSAANGQVVKLQLYYVNQEAADSNKTAQNVRIKIALPANAGKTQAVKSTVKGDNTDPITHQATVNTDSDDAILQYIPGTAVWKHNAGTAETPKIEEKKVSDEIVAGVQGAVLEDQKPGENYAATVSVLARVVTNTVKVTSQSQIKGETNNWSSGNTAKPGDTMRYLISYQNTGTSEQRSVLVRDILPAKAELVPDTTMVTNATNPNGTKIAGDTVSTSGILTGTYAAGANTFVVFEAKIPAADKLACGNNEFRNVAVVKPEGMSEYYAASVTNVKRDCADQPVPADKPAAAYSCDSLTVTKLEGRKIEAKAAYTAAGGAKLKTVTYNFGDGSTPLTTDKTTVQYTYTKDGNFTVSASLLMSVDGKDRPAAVNAACSKPVSFAAAAPAVPTAPAPTAPARTAAPGALPDSGAGGVIGLFVTVTAAGTIIHRLYMARRPAR